MITPTERSHIRRLKGVGANTWGAHPYSFLIKKLIIKSKKSKTPVMFLVLTKKHTHV
jgi:hypothetical protein